MEGKVCHMLVYCAIDCFHLIKWAVCVSNIREKLAPNNQEKVSIFRHSGCAVIVVFIALCSVVNRDKPSYKHAES